MPGFVRRIGSFVMILAMKKILLSVFLLTFALPVFAYNPLVVDPPQPYEIIPIEDDPYVEHQFLGTLTDYPEMFELKTDVSITLKATVRQKSSGRSVPFGLIVVRQNDTDGGVTEVVRQNQPLTEWEKITDSALGMTFLKTKTLEKDIVPGTYRIEVSTPDNKGDYMLTIGDEPVRVGYFTTVGQIYTIQNNFGYTPFHMLFSSYVYYPLGILGVLYGIYRTWRYRKELLHARFTA